MNKIIIYNSLQYITYGWFIISLMTVSYTDLYYRKIPNYLTFSTVILALFTYAIIGGLEGFLFSFYGLTIGFIIFLVPYLLGGMGAGDVKLMCAVGSVLGTSHIVASLIFIALIGGVISIIKIIQRKNKKQVLINITNMFLFASTNQKGSLFKIEKDKLKQEGIPFGIAISGGVFLYFIYLVLNKQPLPFFVVS